MQDRQIVTRWGAMIGDGEKMSFSSISSVLRESVLLEEVLPFVEALFSVFGKDTLGSIAELLWGVLKKRGFNGQEREVNPT